MKKLFWLILACVMGLPVSAWANGETLYMRAYGSCTFGGNGTAYACAASGGAVGAYGAMNQIVWAATDQAAKVDPGDKLYICGNTTIEQMEIYQDGTAALPIDIDFGCPNDPGSITPGLSHNWALYVEGSYLNIHGGTFTGGSQGTVNFATNGGVNTDNSSVRFYNSTVTDCTIISSSCVQSYGDNFTMDHVTIARAHGQGYISHGGRNTWIHHNNISFIDNSDAIMISFIPDGAIIEYNAIDHSSSDHKYCGIAKNETSSGLATFRYNTCTLIVGATVQVGFYSETAALFQGNKVTGGRYGLQCAPSSNLQCDMIGNLLVNQTELGMVVGGSPLTTRMINNTVINAGTQGIQIGNNSASVLIANNIISNAAGAPCINKMTLNVEKNNNLFGCTVAVENSGTPTTVGTGTIITDPLFVSTTDYRLRGTSPARNAGLASGVGLCAEVRGRACYPDHRDMGAYQAGAGDPAAPRTVRTP